MVLLGVAAIVLWLVANSWKKLGPTAIEVSTKHPAAGQKQPPPQGTQVPGGLPDLKQTRAETDKHAAQVQDALKAAQ